MELRLTRGERTTLEQTLREQRGEARAWRRARMVLLAAAGKSIARQPGTSRSRVTENDTAYYPNFVLLGDLNLDLDKRETDRRRIERQIRDFYHEEGDAVAVNFPFLDRHPQQPAVFRTNARLTETFDQIGLFVRDRRFPHDRLNKRMGAKPHGPDYGVFDFVNLFSRALKQKPFDQLGKTARKNLVARFEHKVSDHMPLWLRLPLPKNH